MKNSKTTNAKSKIEYVVTIVNVSGEVQNHTFYKLKSVDAFVSEVNMDTYWDVQKIEKFKKYNFKYDKEIVHSPLWFKLENVTETHSCNKCDYSFLKKHDSLIHIKRIERK